VTSSRVVFALDVPSLERARSLATAVRAAVGMFKVGLELFVESGPEAAAIGAQSGRPLFLDLKLHDIPETVERAVARASGLGARFLTVHASGGPRMLRRATERARAEGAGLEIVAVTVLTSLDASDLRTMGLSDDVESHAAKLAQMAVDQGVTAFVCSPHEASRLRLVVGPAATLITPGVRSAAAGVPDDQKRTMSARDAILRGADWVVVGRPIRDAADPAAAARAFRDEVDEALADRGPR
jgi:orotidine-5'-phosphate decarboxylase